MEETYDTGILGAIVLMGEINAGKSDAETHKMVKQTIIAIEQKKRRAWPDKRLRKLVNETMDELSKKYFLEVLHDMDKALDEHFKTAEV